MAASSAKGRTRPAVSDYSAVNGLVCLTCGTRYPFTLMLGGCPECQNGRLGDGAQENDIVAAIVIVLNAEERVKTVGGSIEKGVVRETLKFSRDQISQVIDDDRVGAGRDVRDRDDLQDAVAEIDRTDDGNLVVLNRPDLQFHHRV